MAVVVGLAAALLAPVSARSAEPPLLDDRPNVLVFMTDDQTLGTLGAMPAVQALQARGTTFTSYYDSYPLCCPARAAFLTGQYSHNNGMWDNDGPLGGYDALLDKDNTLAAWMHDAGYQTGIVGKFLNDYKYDRDGVPNGWDLWRVLAAPVYNYRTTRMIDERGNLVDYGTSTYRTTLLAEFALEAIDDFNPVRPWFMWLTPNAPHWGSPRDPGDPKGHASCSPDPAWAGFDSLAAVPRGPEFNEPDVTDKPRHIRRLPSLTASDRSALRWEYRQQLECLRSADDFLAIVVEHLAEIGELDNTDILFVSDNGYAFGEHRVMDMKRLAYSFASHLPLIAAGPDFAAGTDSLPRSIVDLAATVMSLAEATPGRELDGTPITEPVDPRRKILHEGRWVNPAHDRFSVKKYTGFRTPRWLYLHYEYDEGRDEYEVYDLSADPHELRSRGRSTSSTEVERRKRFEALLADIRNCAGETCP